MILGRQYITAFVTQIYICFVELDDFSSSKSGLDRYLLLSRIRGHEVKF